MSAIKLINVAEYYEKLPHQRAALEWLQSQVDAKTLEKFTYLWRSAPASPAAVPAAAAGSSLRLDNSLASRIVKYVQLKGYKIFEGRGKYNIVYVEGMSAEGQLNADGPNKWNDRRIVIEIADGIPYIVGNWRATSEPGDFYTYNPMNANGCARIAFGQHLEAWVVGLHNRKYEALVQVAPVTVCRDFNKDFKRTGDKTYTGVFGINQHHGYDSANVGPMSAGCLVGESVEEHRAYMRLVKQDVRHKADRNYRFGSTVIPGDDLLKRFPA